MNINSLNTMQSHNGNMNNQIFHNFYQQYQQNINGNNGLNQPILSQYNWNGVMEFLQEQLNNSQIKEDDWKLEKQQLLRTIEQLQQQLQEKDNQIAILNKKLKLIEYSIHMDKKNNLNSRGPNQLNHVRVRSDLVANLIHGQGDKIVTNAITSSVVYSSVPGGHTRKQKSSGGQTLNIYNDEIAGRPIHTTQGINDYNIRPQKRPHHRQTNSFGGSTSQPFLLSMENHKKKSDEILKLHYHSNHSGNHTTNNSNGFTNTNNHPQQQSQSQAQQPQQSQQPQPHTINPSQFQHIPDLIEESQFKPSNNNTNHLSNYQSNHPISLNPNTTTTTGVNQIKHPSSMILSHQPSSHHSSGSFFMSNIAAAASGNNNNKGNMPFLTNSAILTNNPNLNNSINQNMMIHPNTNQGQYQINDNNSHLQQHQMNSANNFHGINQNNYDAMEMVRSLKITPAQKLSLLTNSTNKRKWLENDEIITNQAANIGPNILSTRNSRLNDSKSNIKLNSPKYNPRDLRTNSLNDSAEEISGPHQTRKIIAPKTSLRSHLDGVREVFFASNNPILASVSEDCMVKLWDVRVLSQSNESSHIDPYYTLRYHSGPLFAVTGSPDIDRQNTLLFTAGAEGIIRIWNVPHPDTVDSYGICGNNNFCCGIWKGHQDAIWELNHHPSENLLLSSSADGTVNMWQSFEFEEGSEELKVSSGSILGTFCYKSPGMHYFDTPTSTAWITGKSNNVVIGYAHASVLAVFDRETSKIINTIKYEPNLSGGSCSQVNKLLSNSSLNLLVSAHEDKCIRFFDINSNKMIKSVIGHTDSVTSLSFKISKNHLGSVGHDGSVRTWDMRKYQCIHEIPAHKKKYDESIHTIMHHEKLPLLATGGADGLIKIFQYCD